MMSSKQFESEVRDVSPTQSAIAWLRHELWQRLLRLICHLQGCTIEEGATCVRCKAFIYDPNLLPPPQWLRRISDRIRDLRYKGAHRCEACRRHIWFSAERCCSEECYCRWFPF